MMPVLQMEFQLQVSMVKKKKKKKTGSGRVISPNSKSEIVENYSNIKRNPSLFLCVKPTCSQSVQLHCLLKNETPVLCVWMWALRLNR